MPLRMVAAPLLGVGVLALTMIIHAGMADAQVQCWAPRQSEGPVTDKRWARHLKALNAAETIIKQSQEFMNPPVPVRVRTTMAANRYGPMDAKLIVRAYPEQTVLGIGLWKGDCGIIPEADLMTGSMGGISVFFNHVSKDMFLAQDEVPKLTGTLGGYPEHNGWVIISKNGRLPWIPQTLGERLDRVGATREKALADWRTTMASRKAPDQAMIDRTAALRRRTDPSGADQYVENMKRLTADVQAAQAQDAAREAHLSKLLNEYRIYRASFTAQQLAMPAVWADADGSARKAMEAQINGLHELSEDDQWRVSKIREHSRRLEGDAAASNNEVTALQLRTRAADLLRDADHIRNGHVERAALEEEALRAAYELTNLKPGPAEQALAYKMDPTFPNGSQPGKIQVIAVSVSMQNGEDVLQGPEQAARQAWLERVRASIDYARLAAILD
ncbi:MAG: hypothetical protein A4E19_03085 [Nitrospira sp. SG-bin1]|nr:MAG: hypothetical protein A4E19_03085 [Nitrospira sp. SG-bin1]